MSELASRMKVLVFSEWPEADLLCRQTLVCQAAGSCQHWRLVRRTLPSMPLKDSQDQPKQSAAVICADPAVAR